MVRQGEQQWRRLPAQPPALAHPAWSCPLGAPRLRIQPGQQRCRQLLRHGRGRALWQRRWSCRSARGPPLPAPRQLRPRQQPPPLPLGPATQPSQSAAHPPCSAPAPMRRRRRCWRRSGSARCWPIAPCCGRPSPWWTRLRCPAQWTSCRRLPMATTRWQTRWCGSFAPWRPWR